MLEFGRVKLIPRVQGVKPHCVSADSFSAQASARTKTTGRRLACFKVLTDFPRIALRSVDLPGIGLHYSMHQPKDLILGGILSLGLGGLPCPCR